MWYIFLIVSFIALIYYHVAIKPYKYWKEKGIPYLEPYPLVGNLAGIIFKQKSFWELTEIFYHSFPNNRYIGLYQLLKPALLIRDPELIKRITVKDFDSFPDHRILVPAEADPLWNKSLFSLKNEAGWHEMRATLSPSFTSSKLKMMYGLIQVCAKQFVDYLEKRQNIHEIEMKDLFCRYTNDVIATTAFGITCDSLKDQNNEFYSMGKDASNFDALMTLKVFAYSTCPGLMKLLNASMIPKKISSFFRGIIKETLQLRREKGVIRPDMIHLLTEVQKNINYNDASSVEESSFSTPEESANPLSNNLKKQRIAVTEEDITAQALLFFLAGFETSASFMSFTAYELALNSDIQQRLYEEIKQCYFDSKTDITYERLLGMKYLDMVVTESLRKWPPVLAADRMSVKPFQIEPELPDEKLVTLDSGTNVWIPIYAIHRNPEYYPNPERFDPERFGDENKHNIHPFTYMPFGLGPRNCIGSRFALLEGKLILAELLLRFEIIPIARTQVPLKFKKGSVIVATEEGFWLGLKPRIV